MNSKIKLFITSILIFAYQTGYCETINTVSVPVKFGSSTPAAQNLFGMLVNSGGDAQYYGTTDSSGIMTFYTVEVGTYTLQLRPTQSSSCSGCGLYLNKDSSVLISTSSSGYNSGTNTLTLNNEELEAASRYITVTVKEGANPEASSASVGTPIPGLYVSGWQISGNYASGTTDSNGKVYIAVSEENDDLWSLSTYAPSGGYTQTYKNEVIVASSGSTEVLLEPVPTNATVTLNLKKDGSTYTLPNDVYGSAYCNFYDEDRYYYFNALINPSSSSASMGVLALASGSYSCSIWLEGFGATSATVSPGNGQTQSVDISVIERNASVVVHIVDQNGDLISGLGAGISAYTLPESSTSDGAYTTESGGIGSLSLIDDIAYNIGVYFDQGSSQAGVASTGYHVSANGKKYLNTYSQVEVIADEAETKIVEYPLQEADSTLIVKVRSSSGAASGFAWVGAYEEINEEGKTGTYVGGMTNSSGIVSLPLLGGKTYTVYSFPQGSFTTNVIPPPFQTVYIGEDEEKTITMTSFEANHTVTITPSIVNSQNGNLGVPDYVDCYGRSDGVTSYGNSKDGVTVDLKIVGGRTWVIGCFGYSVSTGDYFYAPEVGYIASGTSGSLSITLTEGGNYYPPISYTFSCTTSNTITLPDGVSELTIPANAIGSSGNCSITVGTATGLTANEEQYPAFALDFTAYDSNGNKVEEFDQTLTLVLYYNEDELPPGMSEETLVGSFYDSDTYSWQLPDSVEVDTDNNRVVISLSHFSSYSITGKIEGLVAPSALKVKNVKGSCSGKSKAVKLSWGKVSGAASYQYQISKSKAANKNKADGEIFLKTKWKSTKSKNNTILCLAAGSYKFRTRAATSGKVPGENAVSKNFKVK